jgi:hypothetical protein
MSPAPAGLIGVSIPDLIAVYVHATALNSTITTPTEPPP